MLPLSENCLQRLLNIQVLAPSIAPQVMPAALEMAMEEDVEFRKGLPLDYFTYMGVQNSDKVFFLPFFFILF